MKSTRQTRWKSRMKRKGLCTQCGQERAVKGRSLGKKCGKRPKLRARRRNGYKPKKKNGVGRPPIY